MEYAREKQGQNFDVVIVNDDLERAYSLFKRAVREGSQSCTGDVVPAQEENAVLFQAKQEAHAAEAQQQHCYISTSSLQV